MTSFVARAGELSRLHGRLDRALAGEGGAVFLTGEAGAGKSTLAERFLQEVAEREERVAIIRASCSEQYGAGEPYQPFVEAFRALVALGSKGEGEEEEEEAAGTGRRNIRQLARQLAPYWINAIPVAGNLISATLATAVELKRTLGDTGGEDSSPSQEALFFQYTELLLAAAAERPLVLFLDDLHWADRASVSLLTHLVRKLPGRPALVLGTYRPVDVDVSDHPLRDARSELERYGVAEELLLEPLGTEALADLALAALGGPAAPDLISWLERHAGANPLFFGELLRWMVDVGIVHKHHDEWTLARIPEDFEIPRSAESVIEKRLRRLDPDVYRVLEYASVAGDEFDSVVLSRLLEMDELALEEALQPLVRSHRLLTPPNIRDLPGGDITSVYRFEHSLFQDVLHRGLQGKRRILLHRRMASILEELWDEGAEGIAHRLALHYDEGRQPDRAHEYGLLAARLAARMHAHQDAVDMLRRALRNATTPEQRAAALERLGEAHRKLGRYVDALAQLDDALSAAQEADDVPFALHVRGQILRVDRDLGGRPPADLRAQLESLAEDARSADLRQELCEFLWLFRDLPDPDTDLAPLREALEITRSLDAPALLARAHFELGSALLLTPDRAEAREHLEEALRLYTELQLEARVGMCHNAIAIKRIMAGDYGRAIEAFSAAAAIFDRIGDPANEASVRNNLGTLLTRTGDWRGAESNLRESMRIARRMDAAARLLYPLQNQGELLEARGDPAEAERCWTHLLETALETGYRDAEIIARCGRGLALVELGRTEEARVERDEATRLADVHGTTLESRRRLASLRARLARAGVDAGEADRRAVLRELEAVESTVAPVDPYLAASLRLERAEWLASEDPASATALAAEAEATFRSLGTEPARQRARAMRAAEVT